MKKFLTAFFNKVKAVVKVYKVENYQIDVFD